MNEHDERNFKSRHAGTPKELRMTDDVKHGWLLPDTFILASARRGHFPQLQRYHQQYQTHNYRRAISSRCIRCLNKLEMPLLQRSLLRIGTPGSIIETSKAQSNVNIQFPTHLSGYKVTEMSSSTPISASTMGTAYLQ